MYDNVELLFLINLYDLMNGNLVVLKKFFFFNFFVLFVDVIIWLGGECYVGVWILKEFFVIWMICYGCVLNYNIFGGVFIVVFVLLFYLDLNVNKKVFVILNFYLS